MINYDTTDKKGNELEKNWRSSQRSLSEISQLISHHRLDFQHKCKIAKLKNDWIDVGDLDTVPFYSPRDWDSYEQYKQIVGGVPGTDGYREVRSE